MTVDDPADPGGAGRWSVERVDPDTVRIMVEAAEDPRFGAGLDMPVVDALQLAEAIRVVAS